MTIYAGSRYEDDPIDRIMTQDGVYEPTVFHQQPLSPQTFNYSVYSTGYNERLDLLAARFYGDPELSWVIANANPEVFYPDQIPVGTVLRIPDGYVYS
jgi:hypothetical protein